MTFCLFLCSFKETVEEVTGEGVAEVITRERASGVVAEDREAERITRIRGRGDDRK